MIGLTNYSAHYTGGANPITAQARTNQTTQAQQAQAWQNQQQQLQQPSQQDQQQLRPPYPPGYQPSADTLLEHFYPGQQAALQQAANAANIPWEQYKIQIINSHLASVRLQRQLQHQQQLAQESRQKGPTAPENPRINTQDSRVSQSSAHAVVRDDPPLHGGKSLFLHISYCVSNQILAPAMGQQSDPASRAVAGPAKLNDRPELTEGLYPLG